MTSEEPPANGTVQVVAAVQLDSTLSIEGTVLGAEFRVEIGGLAGRLMIPSAEWADTAQPYL